MDLSAEQHCAICLCVRLQKLTTKIVRMMKEAYKVQVLGMSTIFQKHKEFSEGQ